MSDQPEPPTPDAAPSSPADAGQSWEPAPRRPKPRSARTVKDMVWSMAVVLAVVVALLVVTWRPQPDPVKVVDYGPVLAQARAQAGYPVLAPTGLGEEWRATSARWEPTQGSDPDDAWHLGLLAPDGTYVQVSQSASDRQDYVEEQTEKGTVVGPLDVGGITWTRYEAPVKDQRSLVRKVGGTVVIVTGTASWETLAAVAGSLRPA